MHIKGAASVGHYDGSISIWDLNMRRCQRIQKIHNGEVRGVSYSADGRFVASAGFDKNINILDTISN
jgi:WD40 repeat protein